MPPASHPPSGSSLALADTGRITIDGGSLFYEAAGSGAPVILIHGGNLDRRMWDPQFELLRTKYRVVRYDARGYGRSSAVEEPFSAHDDLAAPGISGGTWAPNSDTAWRASAMEAVKRSDSVGVARAWLGSDYIRSALHPPERAAWLRQISIENSAMWGGLIRHGDLEKAADPRAADRLETLQAPVLLLVGGSDTPYIHEVAAAITARVPHVKRVDIPSVGHMLNLEAAERFNRELLAFLANPLPR
jgi:3-oxoadipate enol-lactonase